MSPRERKPSSSEQGGDEEQKASSPSCPTCGKPLAIYEGTNPTKQGTGFCANCGRRYPLTTE